MTVSLASPPRAGVLAEILERVHARYNHRRFIGADPLQFAYRFDRPQDAEVACFLAAALAYGRVQQIQGSLNDLFARMDCRPYDFVTSFSPSRRSRLAGFKHRFTTGEDVADLLALLRPVLRRYGSIEAFFVDGYDPSESNVLSALARFCDRLTDAYAAKHGGHVSRGLMYLLASPRRGSASKRLHLFLRWMVRADDVDPGLWKGVSPARLIVPLDVHMARLCRILGLHDSNTISQSTAVQVTERFATIAPADPVKYDFALSRIGILDDCTGRLRPACESCELFEMCLQRPDWPGTNGS
ncbi:MAG: TIGR02757 family protein [Planctomycetota bacterium]|nr:TIGR02757 family protein [Planctomycetota bacterium]